MFPRTSRSRLLCALLFIALAVPPAHARPPRAGVHAIPHRAAVDDATQRLDANQLGMFVTNLGSFAYDANGLVAGLEYPRGTSNSPLYAAGLYLGALVGGKPRLALADYGFEFGPGAMVAGAADDPDKAEYHVYKLHRVYASTSSRDSALASWNAGARPHGAPPVEVLGDGSLSLRCDQLTWSVYNDADHARHALPYGGTLPLGVEVRQSSMAYDQPGALGVTALLEFWIHNRGANLLDSTFVGLWADPDVGDFLDDLAGTDTTLAMAYAYNGTNNDAIYEGLPPAVGIALLRGPILGLPPDTLGLWSSSVYRDLLDPQDSVETYDSMRGLRASGLPIVDPNTSQPTRYEKAGDPVAGTGWVDSNPGDRRFLMTVGPFSFAPGDSVKVLAAVVVGQGTDRLSSITALRSNVQQLRLFAASHNDSLTPTLVSLTSADAAPGVVKLTWSTGPGEPLRASVYRRTESTAWVLVGEAWSDPAGTIAYEDDDVTPGMRYGYRLGLAAPGGGEYYAGEGWVDVPVGPALALAGFRPNPASPAPRVSLTLPGEGRATLELFDVRGRRLVAREVGTLGGGTHVVPLGAPAPLPPGLYFLRLTQDGRAVTARAVVMR